RSISASMTCSSVVRTPSFTCATTSRIASRGASSKRLASATTSWSLITIPAQASPYVAEISPPLACRPWEACGCREGHCSVALLVGPVDLGAGRDIAGTRLARRRSICAHPSARGGGVDTRARHLGAHPPRQTARPGHPALDERCEQLGSHV